MDTTVKQLAEVIRRDYQAGALRLPTLPDLALKIRRAVEDEETSFADVARIIQLDPAMTARVIRVANSSLYGGLAPVASAQAAVARVGMHTTRDLVISLCVRGIFKTRHKLLAKRLKALWRHSVRVAAIASVLGRIGPDLDADRALLAGLMHDIGTLPVLAYAEDFPELIAEPERLERVIARLRGRLGAIVLQTWGFDNDLVRVPLGVEEYTRDPAPMPDYTDVAMLANLFSRFGDKGLPHGPALSELPAFNKFPLSALGPEGGVEILEEAQEEITEVMHVLLGD